MARTLTRAALQAKHVDIPHPRTTPNCPRHHVEMVFTPEKMSWSCPTPHCPLVAHPEHDTAGGKPIVGTGPLQIVIVTGAKATDKNRVFLLAVDSNVMVEVTDSVVKTERIPIGHYGHPEQNMQLVFQSDPLVLDHKGRRTK